MLVITSLSAGVGQLHRESFQKSRREGRKFGVKGGSWGLGGGCPVGRTPARWSSFSVVSAHLLWRKISGLGAERQQSSGVRRSDRRALVR